MLLSETTQDVFFGSDALMSMDTGLYNPPHRIKKTRLAHRVAWELFRGPIPDGLFVLHKCDTPACVAVHHLFLGTQLDNIQDRETKRRGNQARGEQHGFAKLTEQKVKQIRKNAKTRSSRQLAKKYGVGHNTILCVIKRRTWKHV